jgi:ankyrin repeat protein
LIHTHEKKLCEAILDRDMKTAKVLILECNNINQEGRLSGGTPLTTAASSSLQFVKLLLNAGADVNHLNKGGSYGSALVAACFSGNREIVQLLLDAGADLNMQISHGRYGSPLAAACFWEHFGLITLLLDAGASLNIEFPVGKHMNILDDVISRRQNSIIPLLERVEHDKPPRPLAQNFNSTLQADVSHGQEKAVELLLKTKVNARLDLSVKEYDSFVDTAISERHMGVLRLLLSTGNPPSVNLARHWSNKRILAQACENGDLEVLEIVIDSGEDLNEDIEHKGHTSALGVAAYNGQTNAVRLLLDAGADPNLSSIAGRFGSPLAAACWHEGGEDIVALLLRAGADPNSELPCGSFPDAFSAALYFEYPGSIALMLHAGAIVKPLALTLIRELAFEVPRLMETLVPRFISFEERANHGFSPPDRVMSSIVCELPALAKGRSDLDSWLFELGVLIRKEVTMEFTTIHNFLSRTFGPAGEHILGGLVRALSSGEDIYCWSSPSLVILVMADSFLLPSRWRHHVACYRQGYNPGGQGSRFGHVYHFQVYLLCR